jgi:hypothetical protein
MPLPPNDVVQSNFVLDRQVHASERLPFWRSDLPAESKNNQDESLKARICKKKKKTNNKEKHTHRKKECLEHEHKETGSSGGGESSGGEERDL